MYRWSIAVLLALLPGFVSAQEPPKEPYSADDVFKILTANIEQAEKWSKENKRGGHLVASLRSDNETIQKAWPSREKVDDRPYLMGLTLDSYLLDTFVKKAKDALVPALGHLEGAAEDLDIKAGQVRRDGKLQTAVMVRVRTWDGANEVNGYEVVHVLVGLANVQAAFDSFSKFSSPTNEKLFAPGRYIFWARKSGQDYPRFSRRLSPRDKAPIELDLAIK